MASLPETEQGLKNLVQYAERELKRMENKKRQLHRNMRAAIEKLEKIAEGKQ
jgi:hypothetical protein